MGYEMNDLLAELSAGPARFTFASGLDSPYGLAFHGKWLYVGNENAVVRFPYAAGQTAANAKPEQLASLPPGGHSTRRERCELLWRAWHS